MLVQWPRHETSHTGLRITEEDWDAAVKAFTATLAKFKVPAAETNELLTVVGSLKGDIVGR